MTAPDQPRTATDLDPEADLADEVRALGHTAAEEIARRWREENAEAIRQTNAWVAKHGLPLAKYRMF